MYQSDAIPFGNATPVKAPITIIRPVASPEMSIFQTSGLNPAIAPQTVPKIIKPVYAEPELDIKPIVKPAVDIPMKPFVEVDDSKPVVTAPSVTVPNITTKLLKLSILDQLTNYVYKLIFNK